VPVGAGKIVRVLGLLDATFYHRQCEGGEKRSQSSQSAGWTLVNRPMEGEVLCWAGVSFDARRPDARMFAKRAKKPPRFEAAETRRQ
jgi:hypothetical protein